MITATGTTGFLIRTQNTFMFRVYTTEHNFTDYEILHYDLEVTITDTDCVFDQQNQTLNYNE